LACVGATSRPAVPAGSQPQTGDAPAVSSTLKCGARSISTSGFGYFGKQMKFITVVRKRSMNFSGHN